jgi:citrate lyase subunit beta / citryl-CoA lyase
MDDSRKAGVGCVAPLFVPANRPERFVKAAASGADAIILDLEDAVAPDQKNFARSKLETAFTTLPVFVRINAATTTWHEADLAAVATLNVAGIILPKAEMGKSLDNVALRPHPVFALIETARGMAEARSIASTTGVARMVFGSLDYCAELGLAHERECLLAARSELVLASRCAGIEAPIDGVTTSTDDSELVADDARYARKLGFTGKLAIHPLQVGPIADGFRPLPADVEWATRILESGDGVALVGNTMVDEPVRIRARQILDYAGRTRASTGTGESI